MDARTLLRGALAWLAFAAATALALMAAWASMRSLYYPRAGDALGTDGTLGALLGAALLVGAALAHRRLDAHEPDTLPLPGVAAVALPVGAVAALVMAWMTWQVARHSSGWFDGLEYLAVAAGGLVWTLLCLGVVAKLAPDWGGFFTSAIVTAAAIGTASLTFGLILLVRAPELQATAEARNARVPGAELLLVLAVFAALALARRRMG